jgi:hypothetical protein
MRYRKKEMRGKNKRKHGKWKKRNKADAMEGRKIKKKRWDNRKVKEERGTEKEMRGKKKNNSESRREERKAGTMEGRKVHE